MTAESREESREPEGEVLSIHFGRSANCSSVGSVVDVLFVSSTVGMAILASAAILLRRPARNDPREEEE